MNGTSCVLVMERKNWRQRKTSAGEQFSSCKAYIVKMLKYVGLQQTMKVLLVVPLLTPSHYSPDYLNILPTPQPKNDMESDTEN